MDRHVDRRVIRQEFDQLSARQVLLEQPARVHRNAQPAKRCGAQRIGTVGPEVALHGHRRMPQQMPVGPGAQEGIGDAVVVLEIHRPARGPGRGQIGRRRDHHAMRHAHPPHQIAAVPDLADPHRQVEMIGDQVERVVRDLELHLDLRMATLEFGDETDQARLGEGQRRSDPHDAAERLGAADARLGLLDRRKRLLRGFVEQCPFGRERKAAGRALEHRDAQVPLERADLARDRGLGHAKDLSRPREALQIDHRDEGFHPEWRFHGTGSSPTTRYHAQTRPGHPSGDASHE